MQTLIASGMLLLMKPLKHHNLQAIANLLLQLESVPIIKFFKLFHPK
jgi:hypothetical protein